MTEMKKAVILAAGVAATGVAVNQWIFTDNTKVEGPHPDFVDYTNKFGKEYGTMDEFLFRQDLFLKKDELIRAWNLRTDVTHTLAHNKFSDWSDEELKKISGKLRDKSKKAKKEAQPPVTFDVSDLPDSVDWREKGAVGPVQNQGVCSSCWTFAAIGVMEADHFINTGELVKLSEQECLDCAGDKSGCQGGIIDDCFNFAEQNKMNNETEYPYTGWVDSCFPQYDGTVNVMSFTSVERNSQDQLKAAIAQQPTAVRVDSFQYPFTHYFGGIITSDECGSGDDHHVLAVGYGTSDDGTFYYIVKNSWGADWGENGYVRIGSKGDGPGYCGIQQYGVYAQTN